jgi:hypothetical protein
MVDAATNLGMAEYLSGSLDAAASLAAASLQAARRVFYQRGIAYGLLGLAIIRGSTAGPDWSARLHGAAGQALAALGETPDPLEARLRDANQEKLRAEMGEAAFEAAYAAGRALPLEEAIQLALSKAGPSGESADGHAGHSLRGLDST